MVKGTLEIHSENILPIIKKWLYSDKDIFVRELVSNACDAIKKVQILQEDGQQVTDGALAPRIDITIDKEKKTLTFADTGVGMDSEEIQKYIAQIAFSSAEEFMEKYKSNLEGDQFIGHFGLGFYSAYMVAGKVEIDTLSYKNDAEAAFWSCDGSREYLLEKGNKKERGTTITLFVDADNEEYLDAARLRTILNHYCTFAPYPVYLNGDLINTKEPLWLKAPSECKKEDYLDFYHHLYPMEPDPLFWIHLNVDYPFHLKGILYFPHAPKDYDTDKSTVKLFCNRVFVSDNCKEIIPKYLTMLRGAIDSPDIPLNVSRSYLQMDRTVRQLAGHVSKKVSDSLTQLYRNDRERYISSWDDFSWIVKLGVLEDDKFYDRVKELLIWQNTAGEWTTVSEYLERNKNAIGEKVFYTQDDYHNKAILSLYEQKGIEVLKTPHTIDTYVIQLLERKLNTVAFQRIDANIEESLIDKNREKTILDGEGKTEAAHIADLIRSKLGVATVDIEAKSLASDNLPAILIIDEQSRRMRDYMTSMARNGKDLAQGLTKATFVVNTNSALISSLPTLNSQNPDLAEAVVKQVYQLALLSQREMSPELLHEFVHNSNLVLEQLACCAVKKDT